MSELDEDGDGFLQPQVTHIAARHSGLNRIWLSSEVCRSDGSLLHVVALHYVGSILMVNGRH